MGLNLLDQMRIVRPFHNRDAIPRLFQDLATDAKVRGEQRIVSMHGAVASNPLVY